MSEDIYLTRDFFHQLHEEFEQLKKDSIKISKEIETARLQGPIYTIDRIYKSMVGPQSRQRPLSFGETGESEVLWVVRYQSDIVGPDGEAELSPEFNCHSNLNVKVDHFYERWASELWPNGGRLFTLAQGQLSVELSLCSLWRSEVLAGFRLP